MTARMKKTLSKCVNTTINNFFVFEWREDGGKFLMFVSLTPYTTLLVYWILVINT